MATTTISRPRNRGTDEDNRKASVMLWIVQGLLAAIFVCTGSMKLLMPADVLALQTPLPILFVRFLGACEFLGALGLILPGLLRIRPGLTPIAAAGLVPIMIGATVLTPTLMGADLVLALIPMTVGLLAALVAYGRLRLAPLRPRLVPALAS
jgi:DoxX-like family